MLENFRFLIVDGAKVPIGRRLHGKESDDLKRWFWIHVAQTAGGFVKRATVPHAEILGQSYLDAST